MSWLDGKTRDSKIGEAVVIVGGIQKRNGSEAGLTIIIYGIEAAV